MAINSNHILTDPKKKKKKKKKKGQRGAPYYFDKIYNFNRVDQIRFYLFSFLTLND